MQAKEPEVESLLDRANQLYKDNPPSQSDKVRVTHGLMSSNPKALCVRVCVRACVRTCVRARTMLKADGKNTIL